MRDNSHSHTQFLGIEQVVLLFAGLATYLYLLFGASLRDPLELYVGRLLRLLGWYALLLVIALLLSRLPAFGSDREASFKQTILKFKTCYLAPRKLLFDIRIINAVSILFVVFIHLKHLILLVNPKLYDAPLLASERALFGGKLFGEWLVLVIGSQNASIVSLMYTAWYGYLAILIFVMLLQRNQMLSEKFFKAFALMWFLSLMIVYVFPTWGPCFYSPELFSSLPETEVASLQNKLWMHWLHLRENLHSNKGVYLISGLPSIHFAATVLGSWFLARVSRPLAVVSWLFTAATFVATLYFGWHYLLDNVVAVVVSLLLIKFSDAPNCGKNMLVNAGD